MNEYVARDTFHIICRICLCKSDDLRSISETKNFKLELSVTKLLEECFSEQVCHDEEMPQNVCNSCFIKLTAFYNFKLTYIQSQNTLKQTLAASLKEHVPELTYDVKSECEEFVTEDIKPQVVSRGRKPPKVKRKRVKTDKKKAVKPVQCDTCGRIFACQTYLNEHSRVHTGVRPYECKTCGKRFTHTSHLSRHKRIHTCERPYACSHCGKTFNDHTALRSHVRTHTGERPHLCTVCGKTFKQKGQLNCHSVVHSGEKPFQCTMCDKRFPRANSLKVHLRFHTGERTFTCGKCPKTFFTMAHLQRHTLQHDEPDTREFTCTICARTFHHKYSLKEHMACHSEEKLKCLYCPKTYTRKRRLLMHMNKFHDESTVKDEPNPTNVR